jgi:mono/diheme cytochrome c family protein
MMTSLEIKGAVAGVITSVLILVVTFTAAGIYRNHIERETESGTKPLDPAALVARGRSFFFQSCAHCHGQDADGGEDAPSLLKLQISGAHMALLIRSGIKDEMPSFAKKYTEQDTAAIVAYLKTLH